MGIQRDSGNVVISVRNEAYDINKEQQAHIFERFYRVPSSNEHPKGEGLGLDLYIAYEIVTQQGGNMWLESADGKGSTFYFSLPLEKK